MLLATPGDHRLDAASPERTPVFVVVIGPVGEQPTWAVARTANLAGDGHNAVDQGQKLGDVVAIAAGQGDRQRQAAGIGQKVVL